MRFIAAFCVFNQKITEKYTKLMALLQDKTAFADDTIHVEEPPLFIGETSDHAAIHRPDEE
jgi:hypothetical protein